MTTAGELLSRRGGTFLSFAEAVTSEQQDFRVFDEPIHDRSGDGGVEENVAPVGERCIGGDECRTFLAVASRDDLIKQIRCLLVQGQVTQLVHNQKCWFCINPQLADQRVIDLRGIQMVQHVHGSSEQDTLVRLAGAPTDDLSQERLANTGIADEHNAGAFVQEVQIQQAHNPILRFHAALVVFEVEAIDGVLGMQPRQAEAAFDGAAVASIQFDIGERFQGLGETQVLTRRVGYYLIELPAHRRQAELIQFQMQGAHKIPFGTAR